MRTRWRGASTLVLLVLLPLSIAVPAVAQDLPGGSPTTTAPPVTEPPPTVPTTAPSTTSSTSSTLPPETVPPDASLPPVPPGVPPTLPGLEPGQLDELLADIGDGAPDHYASQPAFDPSTAQTLVVPLGRARQRLRLAESRVEAVEALLEGTTVDAVGLERRYHELQDRRLALVADAQAAVDDLRARAVEAFLRGQDPGVDALLGAPDATEAAHRGLLFRALLEEDERAMVAARARVEEASADLRRLVEARLDARRRHRRTQVQLERARQEVERAVFEVSVWQTGSHVMVQGFTFPVASPTSFYDGWGDERMPGTAWSHWHEGTDVLAPSGSDLLAAEDGVVSSTSSHILGGTSLWIDGRSGTRYYYAHLSAYAPGVGEGTEVRAGDVVGYVGDTGNARGTPHLHFEIHVDGRAVNPYPILRVAWEWRVRQAILAGEEPPTVATGPLGGSVAPLPGDR